MSSKETENCEVFFDNLFTTNETEDRKIKATAIIYENCSKNVPWSNQRSRRKRVDLLITGLTHLMKFL